MVAVYIWPVWTVLNVETPNELVATDCLFPVESIMTSAPQREYFKLPVYSLLSFFDEILQIPFLKFIFE